MSEKEGYIGPGPEIGYSIDPSSLIESSALITLINSGAADSKKTHTFREGTSQFEVKSEKVVYIFYNYDETKFDGGDFKIITSGGRLFRENLNLPDGFTIYFKTIEENIIIEIEEWK